MQPPVLEPNSSVRSRYLKPVESPMRVLYISGSGRSGSTLLDIVLNGHPDVQGVGELVNLPRAGWIGNEYCSCGRHANDCPFWTQVRRIWAERVGEDDAAGYLELQESFQRYRRLPKLLRERRLPSARFRSYAERTRLLFEAIREVSGKPVTVDSSKSPLRAFALAVMPGIDLRLVHLTRDGRGVAMSLNKSWRKDLKVGVTRDIKARPVWRTAAAWLLVNLTTGWVRRQLDPGKSVQVRYESLVTDPVEVLGKIGRVAGVDMTGVAETISSGGSVDVGHNIAGNRLRMSKSVSLRPDAGRWKDTLSDSQQRVSWLLMGWLLRRYGYKR